MCRVRGIGVAVSARTSTSRRSERRSSFCATPNRCSSSTITSPSSFGITSRDRTRCVPISTSTLPSANSASTRFTSAAVRKRETISTLHREVLVALAERVPVLLREHRRRHEHQRLLAVQRGGEGGPDRDLRLAEADVAADEPVHRARCLEVLLHGLDRGRLVGGLPVGERGLEPLEPVLREVEGDAGRVLAPRVELEQLARELADRGPGAALEQVPRLAAELGERRRLAVHADVAGDLADLLVRHVEPVLAAEGELEVVARDAGDLSRLEAEQLAEAVILVDDVVARAELGERLERAAGWCSTASRAAAEDLRVRQQGEPEVPPDEATPGRADREQRARLRREARRRARRRAPRPGGGGSAFAAPRPGAGRRRRFGGRRGRARGARSRPRPALALRSRDAGPRTRTAGRLGADRARRQRRAARARAAPPPRPRAPRRAGRRSPGRWGSAARGRRRPGFGRLGLRRRRAATSTRSSRRSAAG